jgi:hypothetical protein
VLLGLEAQLREDTGLSPAEAVFGAQIVLPNEFLQNDELSVDTIVKKFAKTMFLLLLCLGTILAPSCPASCQPSWSPPPSSGFVGAAWFHPFSRSTTAPMRFCAVAPAPSPSESGRGTRWLPSAALRLARLRMQRLAACVAAADHRDRAQEVLPQPSGSRSQTRWSLHLLLLRCHYETVPEPFSYPARRFFHTRDRRRHHRCHRCGTRPVKGTATKVGPLTSSPSSRGQSSGVALWTLAYIPTDRQTSWDVLHHPCTVPVFKLLFIRQ